MVQIKINGGVIMANSSLTKTLVQTKIAYQIVKSTCKTHGSEGEAVFGVSVTRSGEYNDYVIIEDISTNSNEIEELIFRLKKGQVTPTQLAYIVEDYLEELSTNMFDLPTCLCSA